MFERDKDKPGAGRLRTALGVAAVTAVVASMAIVGTVAAQPGQRFLDVPRTHYAYESIEWAVTNEITQGCGDGRNFCPEQTLNRAHMVTFLKRYHDKFHGTAAGNGDNGDDPDEWVVTGFGSTTFADSITLSAGQYVADFTLVLRTEDDLAIKGITVTVAGPATTSERTLLTFAATDADTSNSRLTFRNRNGFEVSTSGGLSRLPAGRIYFKVTVEPKDTDTSIAAAEWEIRVTER